MSERSLKTHAHKSNRQGGRVLEYVRTRKRIFEIRRILRLQH